MATLDAARPYDALAARVATAAAALPEPERRALLLREREDASYEAIASALEVGVEHVPELLVTARMAVREAVRHAPSPPLRTAHCEDARRLLALRQDREYLSREEVEWLRG